MISKTGKRNREAANFKTQIPFSESKKKFSFDFLVCRLRKDDLLRLYHILTRSLLKAQTSTESCDIGVPHCKDLIEYHQMFQNSARDLQFESHQRPKVLKANMWSPKGPVKGENGPNRSDLTTHRRRRRNLRTPSVRGNRYI